MYRITTRGEAARSMGRSGFTSAGDFDIARDGKLEATNYFFPMGDQESVLELTFTHDGRATSSARALATSRSASMIWTAPWYGCASWGSIPSASHTRCAWAALADVRQRPRLDSY